jgi:hypothetical protein
MWTPEHRRAANRKSLRYPSDLTDDEWLFIDLSLADGVTTHGGSRAPLYARVGLHKRDC